MTSSLAAALAASKAKADNIDNNDNNDIHTKASKAASSSLMQHAKQQKPKPTKRVEKEKKQQAAFTSPAKQSLAVASASAGAEKQGMHNSQDIKPTPLKNDKYNGKHFDNNYNDNNNNKDDLKNTYWNGASWEMKWNAHNGDDRHTTRHHHGQYSRCLYSHHSSHTCIPSHRILYHAMPRHAIGYQHEEGTQSKYSVTSIYDEKTEPSATRKILKHIYHNILLYHAPVCDVSH
mmetsp:Transcript_3305/g.6942  ORF Transcript_3305/g.6942 Transcript_3305/m.6942 type:complete len:233 (+) Transcript_3305:174-872(+)